MEKSHIIEYSSLIQFVEQIFTILGASTKDAITITKNLVNADLRGVDSHGVARLSNYVKLVENGRINLQPNPTIVHETPSTATLDADKSIGLMIGNNSMNIAIEKAKKVGTGWVAVNNSNHFGIAANYSMLALEENMIGIAMTNASPIVAPTHSKDKMLGTNPISYAFPSKNQDPFIADFATTTVANGKLEIYQRLEQSTPDGWIQDVNGINSNDPSILKSGGALLPLGGTTITGGHKGYALGSIVDLLSGVLSGASFGPWVPPFPSYLPMPINMPGDGIGHFFGAMRVDAFQDIDEYFKRMDLWIENMRNSKAIDNSQPVLIPGDPERKFTRERHQNGIPLHPKVWEDLKNLSHSFNIPL